MAKVAFTGSFDPPHVGHIYIVDQARRLGHDVLVIVANNDKKTYQSSLGDRLQMARVAFKNAYDVIASDSDNIGDDIKENRCVAIIRGIRDSNDFDYEQTIADWNRENNNLETFYIPCPPQFRNVSSTNIKKGKV